MEEELLTVKEAAKFLRASDATVYRLLKQGELPCIRRGKRYTRIRKSDLLAFLDKYNTRGISKNEEV